jgi:predicted secreted protein
LKSVTNFFLQEISAPDQLYSEIIEVEERVVFQQDKCQIKKSCDKVTGITGEKVWSFKVIHEQTGQVIQGHLS